MVTIAVKTQQPLDRTVDAAPQRILSSSDINEMSGM
jgi:hypothetical protein